MTDQLTAAYETIRDDFMPAERAADTASATTARLLATLLEQRAAAGLAIGTGAPLIRRLAKSLAAQIEAREEFIMAHKLAVSLERDLGLRPIAYGDTEDCPPDFAGRGLIGSVTGAPETRPSSATVIRLATA